MSISTTQFVSWLGGTTVVTNAIHYAFNKKNRNALLDSFGKVGTDLAKFNRDLTTVLSNHKASVADTVKNSIALAIKDGKLTATDTTAAVKDTEAAVAAVESPAPTA